jgi:hypothetical protein
MITSCAGNLGSNIFEDPLIKTLTAYHEIDVSEWKETGIRVAEGEAILLTPLYPKGILYPVKGNIKRSVETFNALDADSEDLYEVKTAGALRIGLDLNVKKPICTGVFIFKNADLDSILALEGPPKQFGQRSDLGRAPKRESHLHFCQHRKEFLELKGQIQHLNLSWLSYADFFLLGLIAAKSGTANHDRGGAPFTAPLLQ